MLKVGKIVKHKKYGKGEIIRIIGNNNYYVKFENARREIVFPADSFTDEYFIFSDEKKDDSK
ncbi:MAG: hypothetical protein WBK54_03520 [Bacilli bacterium]|jgi:hypothetical protein|nr:hypothetical protein [Acholeplasmataceae bacterium]